MMHSSFFSGVHFKVLNKSKGYATQCTRIQIDRSLYKQNVKRMLCKQKNINILQQSVENIIVSKNNVCGVCTKNNLKIFCKCIILTTGTFLKGLIFIGGNKYYGGRMGCPSSYILTEQLNRMEFKSGRFKTGTPPRIDGRYINYK